MTSEYALNVIMLSIVILIIAASYYYAVCQYMSLYGECGDAMLDHCKLVRLSQPFPYTLV